jgi:hypothetical protein
MRLRQEYKMPIDKKIAKYRARMTEKEKRQQIRRIVRSLGEIGIEVPLDVAEAIMWTPHLVIRNIRGQTVYDCSQPLCMSSRDLLGPRAFIALKHCLQNSRGGM